MTAPIPPRYRRLLATYPRAWRHEHGPVVLGTLLEADEAAGRQRPSAGDHLGLLLGGLLIRLPHRSRPVPARFARRFPVAESAFHLFDQANGASPQREETEEELARRDAASAPSLGMNRINAVAPAQMNASGSPFPF